MKPDIPQDQLDRIQPIVDPLLADLRRLSRQLTSQSEPALVYPLEPERAE